MSESDIVRAEMVPEPKRYSGGMIAVLIVGGLLGLCGVSSVLSLFVEDEPQAVAVSEKPEPEATAEPTPPPAPPSFTREDFWTANQVGIFFEQNELKAETEFKNKLVPVVGRVQSVSTDIMGSPYVLLEAKHLLGVQCMFPKSFQDVLVDLQKGQEVWIVGACSGKTLGTVLLRDCRFWRPSGEQ